jgi:hypothetical protein
MPTTAFRNMPSWQVIMVEGDDTGITVTTVSKNPEVQQSVLIVSPTGQATSKTYAYDDPQATANVALLIANSAAGIAADHAAKVERARRRWLRAERQKALDILSAQVAEVQAQIATDPNPPAG